MKSILSPSEDKQSLISNNNIQHNGSGSLFTSGVASTTSSPGHRLGSVKSENGAPKARAILATPLLKHAYACI